jgi:DNA-directed RNA polymerase I subunit RPA1
MGDTSKVNFVSQGGDKVGRGRITESGEEVDELEGGPKSGDAVDSLLDGPKDDDEEAGDSDEEGDEANAEYDDNEEDVSAPADSGSDSEYEDKAVEAKAVEKQPTPVEKKKAKAPREAAALGSSKQSKKEGWVEFALSYPATSRRLLMVQLADEAAAQVAVRSVKFITNAYSLESDVNGETRACVQTEGVNFEAAWGLSEKLIDSSEIKCNDIFSILHTYGVEAARRSIVSEITGVFGVYGINVNPRHLSLIADHMTRSGGYVPMNRMGMNECSSPLLQMSFETTCNFLTRAAQEGLADNMESPSARIVLGKVPKLGTGAFELLVPIEN